MTHPVCNDACYNAGNNVVNRFSPIDCQQGLLPDFAGCITIDAFNEIKQDNIMATSGKKYPPTTTKENSAICLTTNVLSGICFSDDDNNKEQPARSGNNSAKNS